MGLAKEKAEEKCPCPEAWEKRKRKRKKEKDNPYLKIKDRVMQKGMRVPSRKIPHTCTS